MYVKEKQVLNYHIFPAFSRPLAVFAFLHFDLVDPLLHLDAIILVKAGSIFRTVKKSKLLGIIW